MKRAILTALAALLAIPLLGADGCFGDLMGRDCNHAEYFCGFNLQLARTGWAPGTRLEGTAAGEPFSCTLGDHETDASCNRTDLELHAWETTVSLSFRDRAPKTIDLTVREGDAVIFAETFRPRYVTDEPNGEGCGKCTRATEERTLAPGAEHCTADAGCSCVRDDPCHCTERFRDAWYWTVCPEGYVPPSECDPTTCNPCDGPRESCVDDCAHAVPDTAPATCVAGAWTCTDATHPYLESECED